MMNEKVQIPKTRLHAQGGKSGSALETAKGCQDSEQHVQTEGSSQKASAGLQLWLPSQGQLKQVLHLTPWVTCGQAFHFVTHL